MSEACQQKTSFVARDGLRTTGTVNCSRDLGHDGRHRGPIDAEDPYELGPSFLEWGGMDEPRVPTCGDVQTSISDPTMPLTCRLPAGHPMWHFSGLVAWPRAES